MGLGINKVIRILISSDIMLQSGWGLIGPIFAIFLTRQIQGGRLEMVGFIAAAYWITKSIVQPFIAHKLDVKGGERDDFKLLVLGMFLANLVPIGYFFSTQIWHIFVLECFRGLAMACVIPSWAGIFTRHIDRGREAFSWSLESTGVGFAAGIAGAYGRRRRLQNSFYFNEHLRLNSFFSFVPHSPQAFCQGPFQASGAALRKTILKI